MSPLSRIPARHANAEAGFVTTTEFALILPVLLLLLFGIIELGNVLRVQVTLHSAAMSVAHQVSLDPTVRTQAAAKQYMLDSGLVPMVQQASAAAPDLALTPENPSCTSAACDPFEVAVTYTYSAIAPLMQPFFDGLTLSASVKKTAEPGTGTTLVSQ